MDAYGSQGENLYGQKYGLKFSLENFSLYFNGLKI
jgi:hypothetical protein